MEGRAPVLVGRPILYGACRLPQLIVVTSGAMSGRKVSDTGACTCAADCDTDDLE